MSTQSLSSTDHLKLPESTGNIFYNAANVSIDAADTCSLFHQPKSQEVALRALKCAGVLSLFTGALTMKYGVEELQLSQKFKDFWGELIGVSYIGIGGMQVAGGGSIAGMGASSLVHHLTSAKTASVFSNTLRGLGGGLLSGASLWGVLVVGIQLKLVNECKGALAHILEKEPEQALSLLRHELLDPEKGILWKRVLPPELISQVLKESKIPPQELLATIKSEIDRKSTFTLFVACLSIATMLVTLFSFALVPLVATLALSITLSLLWVVLDLVNLLDQLNKGKVESWERGSLCVLTGFNLAFTTLAGFFTSDLPLKVSAALLGTLLILVQLFSIYKISM